MNSYLKCEWTDDAHLIVTMNDPSGRANRTTDLFKAELEAVLSQIADAVGEGALKGVILLSAKSSFCVGGDIDQITAYATLGLAASFADSQRIKALFRRIETCGVPVVACLAGTAAGGGFELALACHARICVDDPAIRIGLPEVTLGLVPGAGGILRSVHMLGIDKAIPLVADGRLMSPTEAAKLGIVTQCVATAEDLVAAAKGWIAANPAARQPWEDKQHKIPGGGLFADPRRTIKMQALTAKAVAAGAGRLVAPVVALGCIADIAQCGFADGGVIESRAFARQAASAEARSQIGLAFSDRNVLRRAPSRPAGIARRGPPRSVGIVGAGLMGAGIAYANARVGIPVRLVDTHRAQAERGLQRIRKAGERALKRGDLSAAGLDALMARVTIGEGIEHLAGCELLIEAVFEDIALKQTIITQLDTLVAPDGFVASNTSALPIGRLAGAMRNRSRLIGLHFFSPVDRMDLVEIVRGPQTGEPTLARAHDYVSVLGKIPIVVRDSHGFFASRVFQKFIYEAAAMVGEGIPPALVENAALQAGYPAGPLALIDDTSLTLSVSVIAAARAAAITRGLPPEDHPGERIIQALVNEEHRPGRQAGRGFYEYDDTGKRLWPGLSRWARPGPELPDAAELAGRFLYAQVADVMRTLAEGVIRSQAEVNVGAIKAIGFPKWTGGPLRFVAETGTQAVFDRLQTLSNRYGPRFAPPVASVAAMDDLIAQSHRFDHAY